MEQDPITKMELAFMEWEFNTTTHELTRLIQSPIEKIACIFFA